MNAANEIRAFIAYIEESEVTPRMIEAQYDKLMDLPEVLYAWPPRPKRECGQSEKLTSGAVSGASEGWPKFSA